MKYISYYCSGINLNKLNMKKILVYILGILVACLALSNCSSSSFSFQSLTEVKGKGLSFDEQHQVYSTKRKNLVNGLISLDWIAMIDADKF